MCLLVHERASVCPGKKKKMFHRGKFIQHHTDPITEGVLRLCVYVSDGALVYVCAPGQVSTHIGQRVLGKIKEREFGAKKRR